MELLNERMDDNGDYVYDVEYNEEELNNFKYYAKEKGKDVDNMKEEDIVQFSILGLLQDYIKEAKAEEENKKERE